ncbi:hypothetical protein BDV59DRAFT_123215 [Aspergillus ambiguus]|uniref:uncharacterized protein n=1 Tax=Aspergillus ambiguus TaxID=176160 RepID=UPI003CCE060D
MCYRISRYHALCHHQTPSAQQYIACEKAMSCGYTCSTSEHIAFPVVGKCDGCQKRCLAQKQVKSPPALGPKSRNKGASSNGAIHEGKLYKGETEDASHMDASTFLDTIAF